MTMEKRISTDGLDWGPDHVVLSHRGAMTKLASAVHTPSELLTVIDKLTPRPEGVYVLINALGAGEYWGQNRNGDYFPEWSLLGKAPPDDVRTIIERWNADPKNKDKQRPIPVPDSYGYKTFVTTAKPYILHVNKDPLKATGDVIASAYNHHMHRVELIVFIYEARDPEGVKALRADEPVAWSMGARVPFDACTICLNLAKNRNEYCSDLLIDMNQVQPDGRIVGMYNWFPHFFDISRVRVPADKSAWTLRKVASATMRPPLYKRAVLKAAAIAKEAPTNESRSLGSAPIDPSLLTFVRNRVADDCVTADTVVDPQMEASVREQGLSKVLGALALAGIVLRSGELNQLSKIRNDDVPKSLDLKDVPVRLLTVIRAHVPSRSLKVSELDARNEGRNGKSATTTKTADGRYSKYLETLRNQLPEIVKEASSARVRVALDPDCIGAFLMKSAYRQVPEEAWLPFVVAVTSGLYA